ncbi:unnamed protein product [Rodentolepis nana]|uniref:CNH domain-containing protein n=1 Tax=Rodentolepis nana TaxID=102285 RepID=A0A0R3T7F3_RODNA|nr:unnamed protein product [Rodentolepis nana]
MAVRFCLNDFGFQLPDDGLSVFTTFLKVKLTCKARIPSSVQQEEFYSLGRQVHLHQEDNSVVDFDYIVASGSFVGADKDLYFVGLFAPNKFDAPLQRLHRALKVPETTMALCIFRQSDLDSLLKEAPLLFETQNEPIKNLLAVNSTEVGGTIESSRFMRINASEKYLNSFQHCKRTKKHSTIRGLFVETPWKPTDNGEALAVLQTKERFVAILVESVDSFSDLPRRKLTQGRAVCILYALTESSNLLVFLLSKRDLFPLKNSNSKNGFTKTIAQDLLLTGGIELLFSVMLSPQFLSSSINMEFTAFREITIADGQKLGVIDLQNCFTACHDSLVASSLQVFRVRVQFPSQCSWCTEHRLHSYSDYQQVS